VFYFESQEKQKKTIYNYCLLKRYKIKMDSIQPTVTICLVNQRRFERKNVLEKRAFIVLYLYYKSNKRNKCEKCKSQ